VVDLAHRTFDEQVSDAVAWLSAWPRTRLPVFSYALKHHVQASAGRYVSGPAVVEAARLTGLRVSEPTSSGNAWIAKRAEPTDR
jgi:hypothetical protein